MKNENEVIIKIDKDYKKILDEIKLMYNEIYMTSWNPISYKDIIEFATLEYHEYLKNL